MKEEVKEKIEKEFEKTKFAKGGGSCFECCDYEEMYDDLLESLFKALKTERDEFREKIEKLGGDNVGDFVLKKI